MSKHYNRRQALKTIATASAAAMLPRVLRAEQQTLQVAGRELEIQITSISDSTFRLTLLPIQNGRARLIPDDGSLVRRDWGAPLATLRANVGKRDVKCGALTVHINSDLLTFNISDAAGKPLQQLTIDPQT